MNSWNIPDWLELEIRERDKKCIYCRIALLEGTTPTGQRKAVATWEHIINDASIVSRENIARCCTSCNSRKGTKDLSNWLGSRYCIKRGITAETVADVVKRVLRTHP